MICGKFCTFLSTTVMETTQTNEPAAGRLLISDPFLRDPNFSRTVVCLCAHSEEGSVGFVLNRPYQQQLGALIPDLEGFDIPLYYGGPVEQQTLHMVHAIENLGTETTRIGEGLYWGADFELIVEMIKAEAIDLDRIRFFMGYSGWSAGQLLTEMEDKSWLVTPASAQLIFQTPASNIWRTAVLTLGEQFHPLVHYPLDPQLN